MLQMRSVLQNSLNDAKWFSRYGSPSLESGIANVATHIPQLRERNNKFYKKQDRVKEEFFDGGVEDPKPACVRVLPSEYGADQSQKGYQCGRRAYFIELSHQERTYTDEKVLCLFAQIMQDNMDCLDEEDDSLLYWCVGDFFGVLSGQLFPLKQEEQVNWQRSFRLLSWSASRWYVPWSVVGG
jgi:hypothetical protein